MESKKHIYLVCITILISSIVIGSFVYNGLEVLGQYINDGLRTIGQYNSAF